MGLLSYPESYPRQSRAGMSPADISWALLSGRGGLGPRAEEIGESACELHTTDDQPRQGKTMRRPNSLVGGSASVRQGSL